MENVRKGEDSEDVEIDLDSDLEESENGEDPEVLWRKAPPVVEDEDNIHTSALVEISDTKPLISARDPRAINDCLKVTFEDVIAEPVSVRSGDRVWIWSHALFEVSRVWIYRIVSVLLLEHILKHTYLLITRLVLLCVRMVSPCIQCVLIGSRWLQSLWSIAGRCCGGFSVHLAKE
uniref:Caveolin n=1 Tax=Neogobius melanostomus TaxID=47308 RepID=A0A8C6URH5_9GOBI